LNRQAMELRAGVDIVIATPGRLNDLIERGSLSVGAVRIAVLDEADQMADLGFLPQVERILDQIDGDRQTLLFSATLDGDVDRLIRRYQNDPIFHEVETPAEELPTMKHRFIAVAEDDKAKIAADIAAGPSRTLLFVRTQRGAERLARKLSNEGVEAGILHGGLSQPRRERALDLFSRGTVPVLVATNIAARGIHVDGVDIVVHHDPPEDTKTYLHRSGRTARAGASGVVVTLVAPEQTRDVNIMRREAGVTEAIVSLQPGDLRLTDLAAWNPPHEEPPPANQPRTAPDVRPGRDGGWRGGNQRRGRQGGPSRSWSRSA